MREEAAHGKAQRREHLKENKRRHSPESRQAERLSIAQKGYYMKERYLSRYIKVITLFLV